MDECRKRLRNLGQKGVKGSSSDFYFASLDGNLVLDAGQTSISLAIASPCPNAASLLFFYLYPSHKTSVLHFPGVLKFDIFRCNIFPNSRLLLGNTTVPPQRIRGSLVWSSFGVALVVRRFALQPFYS